MHHFLIARLTSKTPKFGVLNHDVFSLFFTSRALSVTKHHQVGSFTVSSLINSCGLSPEMTLKLSKRLQRRYPDGSNGAVELFMNYGFSDTQLHSLVKKLPLVLLAKPEKTLLPKLRFLRSIGLSTSELPRLIVGNPSCLTKSLEKTIIPCYEVIRSLVRSDKEVASTFKHWQWHSVEVINDSVPNIEALRQLDLPQGSISLLVTNFPSVAFMKHSKFVEAVNIVKEMGFDPLKTNFIMALQVVAKMNKTTWESRLKNFERWGWSRDICLLAFRRHPHCMMLSEMKIMKMMNFLVKDMGFNPEDIARSPAVLDRKLEKTFVPRYEVIKILKSSGLVKSDLHISTYILISERRFLQRYVTRFQKSMPLLLETYKGQKSD